MARAEIAAEKEALAAVLPTDLGGLEELVRTFDPAKPKVERSVQEKAILDAYRSAQETYRADEALAIAREDEAVERYARDSARAGQ